MNRRDFLNRAMMAAGLLAVDPERLLWMPGQKTIFIPAASDSFTAIDMAQVELDVARQLGYRAGLTVDTIIRQEFEWQVRLSRRSRASRWLYE